MINGGSVISGRGVENLVNHNKLGVWLAFTLNWTWKGYKQDASSLKLLFNNGDSLFISEHYCKNLQFLVIYHTF